MNAPVITTTKPLSTKEMEEIAKRIRARIRRTVEDIIETGRDLTRVKAALDHGEFGEWINREFFMTMRSAQRYIQAAEWAEGKNDIVSHLPPTTLYLLSAKSTPEEIQAEVVSDLKAGKPVEVRRIEHQIADAKLKRRDAAQAKRRNQRRSKAAIQRRERETEKRQIEMQERKAREEQATSEILSILRKLGRTDLDRLAELFEVVQTWQVQQRLAHILEPPPGKQWAIPATSKRGRT